MSDTRPPVRLLRAIRRSRSKATSSPGDARQTAEAARELLRRYRHLAADGSLPNAGWRSAAKAALTHIGCDAERRGELLRDYDHRRHGPFLGVSDDGDAADDICRAAWVSPKAMALGRRAAPLTIGVAVDAERLGGVRRGRRRTCRVRGYLGEVRRPGAHHHEHRQPGKRPTLPDRSGDHDRRRRDG